MDSLVLPGGIKVRSMWTLYFYFNTITQFKQSAYVMPRIGVVYS